MLCTNQARSSRVLDILGGLEAENTQKQPCINLGRIKTLIHELWMTIKCWLGAFITYQRSFNKDRKAEWPTEYNISESKRSNVIAREGKLIPMNIN